MTLTTVSPQAIPWIAVSQAARAALRAAVPAAASSLPAQFLGEGYLDGGLFEVMLGYYRWHVRIRVATRLHESGDHYEAVFTAAYREASASTVPAMRLVQHWKTLASMTIANREVDARDLAAYLLTLRNELEHQPDVIAWVFHRRPY